MADLDVEQNRQEELVMLCDDSASDDLRALNSVRRHVTQEAPRRVVRMPWGDVPTPWVDGFSTIYDTGIDDSVDDGRTWDNCAAVCDGFYERLKKRFSITMDAGTHFMIGMDIAFGEGWLKISSVHEGPRPRTIHQVA